MGERGVTAYDVVSRYDDAYYGDLAQRYTGRSRFARRRIANVLALLPELAGRKVLDLGCGMGTFTLESARRGAHAVGVDLMGTAMAAAGRVARTEGVDGAGFVRGDAAGLPLKAASFDVVIAADFTEHLDDVTLASVLAETRRVLRKDGTLVLYTPSPTHFLERMRERGVILRQDSSHIGLRTAEELAREVERAGFRVQRRLHLPSHLPILNVAERALGRWVPLLRRRVGIVAGKAD